MQAGFHREMSRFDELARLDSPIHRLDARALALVTMAFILVVMSYPRYEVSALMPLFVFPVVLVAVAGLPAGALLRKLALALPFALFVGLFNPIMDRQAMIEVGPVRVTGGWLSLASIMVRFVLTVSAALILVSCTGIHRLCAGLERLGMPRVFALQILFLYRYFFVIGDEGVRMKRSVECRTAGRGSMGMTVYGQLIGHLLLRSLDRAQRLYGAMVARGFDGEIRPLDRTVWGWKESGFGVGWLAFFLAMRVLNGADWLGALLMRLR